MEKVILLLALISCTVATVAFDAWAAEHQKAYGTWGERQFREVLFTFHIYILFSHFSQIVHLSFPSHLHRFTNSLCLKSNFLFNREYGRRTCRRSLHITSEL